MNDIKNGSSPNCQVPMQQKDADDELQPSFFSIQNQEIALVDKSGKVTRWPAWLL